MPTPLSAGFCPSCQELLAPAGPRCPGCRGNLVPITITDAPDHVVAGVGEAIAAGEVIRFGFADPAEHALFLAELILREALAA